ncbi:Metaxin-3 [Neolecta irregularis DAH-3]|uniref:Metaxin-3 n=1 Tax=Neolecta irregularis (strain DAH-3) TaxID=1198029 RepID=A0A1U7LUS3_NEOID|nr:Metaxin-3 [Neolecta irregularis DAH-3]|eukprot:OLL26394.1 Metaxin-3 [Neolecta irregularis DAH-3]
MTIIATLYISPLPPHLSPQSTALHAYVALSTAPVKVIRSSLPPFDEPPIFIDGTLFLKGFENILSYFRKTYFDLDSRLDAKQSAESIAFSSFVKSLAEPLTLHTHVINFQNYPVTRSQISAQIPFPVKYWTAHSLLQSAQTKLVRFGLHQSENDNRGISLMKRVVDSTQVDVTIQKFAKELYSCLEWKLGTQDLLFGTTRCRRQSMLSYTHISLLI